MKKQAVILACLLALSMTGCSGTAPGPETKPPAPTPAPGPAAPAEQQPPQAQQKEILIGLQQVPAEGAAWAESLKQESGVFRRTVGDWDLYMVAMGEQRTGGYAVELAEAGFSGGTEWLIDVRYQRPGPGDIVTQALTYPYLVFAVPKGIPAKVRLVDEGPEPRVLQVQGR